MFCCSLAKSQLPYCRPMSPYILDPSDSLEAIRQCQDLLSQGMYTDVTDKYNPRIPRRGVYYACVFIVHQKNKARMITDHTEINHFLSPPSFKMDTPKVIRQFLVGRHFRFGACLDVKTAFPHLWIHPKHRELLLVLTPTGRVLSPNAPLFGLSTIPYLWTKVLLWLDPVMLPTSQTHLQC